MSIFTSPAFGRARVVVIAVCMMLKTTSCANLNDPSLGQQLVDAMVQPMLYGASAVVYRESHGRWPGTPEALLDGEKGGDLSRDFGERIAFRTTERGDLLIVAKQTGDVVFTVHAGTTRENWIFTPSRAFPRELQSRRVSVRDARHVLVLAEVDVNTGTLTALRGVSIATLVRTADDELATIDNLISPSLKLPADWDVVSIKDDGEVTVRHDGDSPRVVGRLLVVSKHTFEATSRATRSPRECLTALWDKRVDSREVTVSVEVVPR